MARQELDRIIGEWNRHAENVTKLLQALPADKYDFRPDEGGRSLGELAWHLAEVDAYMTDGIAKGGFNSPHKPPGIERPREIAALAPGFDRVHKEAVARLAALSDADLDRTVPFFDGRPMAIRHILTQALVSHSIHHAGQLTLMCRLAGGTPPGAYGPNREATLAMRAARQNA